MSPPESLQRLPDSALSDDQAAELIQAIDAMDIVHTTLDPRISFTGPPASSHCCSCHVLSDIMAICQKEEMPSVEQSLLLNHLSHIKPYRCTHANRAHSTPALLNLLLDFVRKTYPRGGERHSSSSAAFSSSPSLPTPACYEFLTLTKPATKIIKHGDSEVKSSRSGDTTISDLQKFGDEEGWRSFGFDVHQTTTIQSSSLRQLDHADSDAKFIETSPDDASSETSFEPGSEISSQTYAIVEQESPGLETICQTFCQPVPPPARPIIAIAASQNAVNYFQGSRSTDTDETLCEVSVDDVSSARDFDLGNEMLPKLGGVGMPVKIVTPPNTPSLTPAPFGDRRTDIQCYTHQLPSSSLAEPLSIAQLQQPISNITTTNPLYLAGTSKDTKDVAHGSIQQDDVAARLSTLEFKTADEVWDEKARKYAIVEPLKAEGQVTGLNRYVFVVRRRVDRKTKDTTQYIDVESEPLRDFLREILKRFRGINLNERKISIDQNILYTTLDDLEWSQKWNEITPLDQLRKEQLKLLVNYLKVAYSDTADALSRLRSDGYITYDLLWALFKPNTLIYTTCSGTHKSRCVRYNSSEEKTSMAGAKYWSLDCRYLDFNGEDLGLAVIELKIPKFRGARQITALEAFPLQYHGDTAGIRAELLSCGRKFMRLRGAHHCHCSGSAFYKQDGELVQVHVDSRIMVDAAFFRKMNAKYSRPPILDLINFSGFSDQHEEDESDDSSASETSLESAFDSASRATSFKPGSEIAHDQAEGSAADENLLICCPTVPGFSFKDKIWAEFAVADIKEIKWSSAPFNGLTLPNEQIETIIALTDTEIDSEFDDIVEGKGRGILILLHGNPGVGKTLTAEAVAEHRRKPMYSISIGELPVDAGKLESQLSRIFQIAKHWDAIMLLDEADVYLEQRKPQDLVRNGLVSIFLRVMEYCQGIMFLTTNRVSQFDTAALSRIHLKLKYDDLGLKAKHKIWKTLLDRAKTPQGPVSISAREVESLCKTHLNGREIKNIIAIAQKLAIKQMVRVTFMHLKRAIAASKDFIDEINGTEHVNSIFN